LISLVKRLQAEFILLHFQICGSPSPYLASPWHHRIPDWLAKRRPSGLSLLLPLLFSTTLLDIFRTPPTHVLKDQLNLRTLVPPFLSNLLAAPNGFGNDFFTTCTVDSNRSLKSLFSPSPTSRSARECSRRTSVLIYPSTSPPIFWIELTFLLYPCQKNIAPWTNCDHPTPHQAPLTFFGQFKVHTPLLCWFLLPFSFPLLNCCPYTIFLSLGPLLPFALISGVPFLLLGPSLPNREVVGFPFSPFNCFTLYDQMNLENK